MRAGHKKLVHVFAFIIGDSRQVKRFHNGRVFNIRHAMSLIMPQKFKV